MSSLGTMHKPGNIAAGSVWPAQVIQSTWESLHSPHSRMVPMGVIAKIGYSHTAQ